MSPKQRRNLFGASLVAATAAALVMAALAFGFKLTPTSPTNRHVVNIPSSATVVVYVHFIINVDLAGCFINPQVEPYHVELFQMRFSPLNGRGKSFTSAGRGLLKPDHHHLIEDFDSGSPSITLSGDAYIVSGEVADGELLRWTLPAQCVDAGDPNTLDKTAATGTLRIKKAAGAHPTVPPKKPPAKKPSRKRRHGGGTSVPFRITRIDSPQSVQQNGPRGIATIYWSGHPTFPVTMHDAPASCPAGFNCDSETTIAAERANPLRWDPWWCAGNVTSNWTLDYWFWLTDAKGHRTQRVREQVTCNVG